MKDFTEEQLAQRDRINAWKGKWIHHYKGGQYRHYGAQFDATRGEFVHAYGVSDRIESAVLVYTRTEADFTGKVEADRFVLAI